MKVLITGGNGYIAKSLYASLSDLYEMTLITRADFDLRNSVQTASWFSDKMFDVVIHTAIVGGHRLVTDTMDVMDSNLRMYYNLLDNKTKFNKFISIGSGAELYLPHTPYGLSKHTIRQSILDKQNFYNLRVFGVFDENELDTRFIKANILRYIRKEPIIIHKNRQMDFFYMQDLVGLINFYIENNSLSKEVNCSYENKYTLLDIANVINSLSNHKVEILTESTDMDISYIGESELPINTTGLLAGISHVYNKLLSNS